MDFSKNPEKSASMISALQEMCNQMASTVEQKRRNGSISLMKYESKDINDRLKQLGDSVQSKQVGNGQNNTSLGFQQPNGARLSGIRESEDSMRASNDSTASSIQKSSAFFKQSKDNRSFDNKKSKENDRSEDQEIIDDILGNASPKQQPQNAKNYMDDIIFRKTSRNYIPKSERKNSRNIKVKQDSSSLSQNIIEENTNRLKKEHKQSDFLMSSLYDASQKKQNQDNQPTTQNNVKEVQKIEKQEQPTEQAKQDKESIQPSSSTITQSQNRTPPPPPTKGLSRMSLGGGPPPPPPPGTVRASIGGPPPPPTKSSRVSLGGPPPPPPGNSGSRNSMGTPPPPPGGKSNSQDQKGPQRQRGGPRQFPTSQLGKDRVGGGGKTYLSINGDKSFPFGQGSPRKQGLGERHQELDFDSWDSNETETNVKKTLRKSGSETNLRSRASQEQWPYRTLGDVRDLDVKLIHFEQISQMMYSPQQNSKIDKTDLKAKLRDQNQTIWGDIAQSRVHCELRDWEFNAMEKYFSKQKRNVSMDGIRKSRSFSGNPMFNEAPGNLESARRKTISIIDPKNAQMTTIVLKGIYKQQRETVQQVEDVARKLVQMDIRRDEGMNSQSISNLLQAKLQITSGDMQKILQNAKDVQLLGEPERFFYYTRHIPNVQDTLQAMLFLLTFDEEQSRLLYQLSNIHALCLDVQNNVNWKIFLGMAVGISNTLRASNRPVQGIELQSLVNALNTKGYDKKTSLHHLLMAFLQQRNPKVIEYFANIDVSFGTEFVFQEAVDKIQNFKQLLAQGKWETGYRNDKIFTKDKNTEFYNRIQPILNQKIQLVTEAIDKLENFLEQVVSDYMKIRRYLGYQDLNSIAKEKTLYKEHPKQIFNLIRELSLKFKSHQNQKSVQRVGQEGEQYNQRQSMQRQSLDIDQKHQLDKIKNQSEEQIQDIPQLKGLFSQQQDAQATNGYNGSNQQSSPNQNQLPTIQEQN